MERGRTPEDVEGRPSGFEVAGLVVHEALHRDVAVEEVRGEQEQRGRGEEVEREPAPARHDREPHDHGQQHEVHERVAHADELLQRRRRRVVRDRAHEERPRDDTETDRDDQGVDEAFPVATRTAAPDEQQDAGDEAGVHREVEDVTDRRERQRGAEELLVVVGDDVAGDEERLAQGEQVPRRRDRGFPHAHRLHDRDRRRQCDEVEDEALSEPGDEQVRQQCGFRGHQVEKPGPLLHHPGIGVDGAAHKGRASPGLPLKGAKRTGAPSASFHPTGTGSGVASAPNSGRSMSRIPGRNRKPNVMAPPMSPATTSVARAPNTPATGPTSA